MLDILSAIFTALIDMRLNDRQGKLWWKTGDNVGSTRANMHVLKHTHTRTHRLFSQAPKLLPALEFGNPGRHKLAPLRESKFMCLDV